MLRRQEEEGSAAEHIADTGEERTDQRRVTAVRWTRIADRA